MNKTMTAASKSIDKIVCYYDIDPRGPRCAEALKKLDVPAISTRDLDECFEKNVVIITDTRRASAIDHFIRPYGPKSVTVIDILKPQNEQLRRELESLIDSDLEQPADIRTTILEAVRATPKPGLVRLLHWSELDQLPESKFLPNTHLVEFGYNLWYGLSGTAKSFMALMIGFLLSRTGLGVVIYVSPEGKGAWAKRVKSWSQHTGLDPDEMYFYPGAINLLDEAEVSEFNNAMQSKFKDKVLLVVFDTKSRMMPGADENQAKDDGLQVANSDRIKEALGCTILLIHHSDKKDLSARGSGATINAADCILKFTRASDDLITISVRWPEGKLKDGEPWPDETYRFLTVGDSVVLVPADSVPPAPLSVDPKLIPILDAIDTYGEQGATYKEIAFTSLSNPRTAERYVKLLIGYKPPLVKSLGKKRTSTKRVVEVFVITDDARQLRQNEESQSKTAKPNGDSHIVNTFDSSTVLRQYFDSEMPLFDSHLSSKRGGETVEGAGNYQGLGIENRVLTDLPDEEEDYWN